MRNAIIMFLKRHPVFMSILWRVLHVLSRAAAFFIPVKERTALFASFGGRNFDDSPRAIYEKMCEKRDFDDWDFVWAFVEPEKFEIPRGRKIRMDSLSFFMALLSSRVWVSNFGMDRNLHLLLKRTVRVETWHGTPFKRICSDQNTGSLGNEKPYGKTDKDTIRCAQSEYDRDIFMRVFGAARESFLLCGLPRNDVLLQAGEEIRKEIRKRLNIPEGKKVLLYMPTYREYQVNEKNQTFLAPPVQLEKWRKRLGEEYVLLVRAHYAVNAALGITDDDFVRDVSGWPALNELYLAADLLLSDYSSAYVDYSLLERPMLCFAYDYDEYVEKRGLYLDLEDTLPCPVDRDEESVLWHIESLDQAAAGQKVKKFRQRFAPNDGNAAEEVVSRMLIRLNHKSR